MSVNPPTCKESLIGIGPGAMDVGKNTNKHFCHICLK